MTDGEQVIQNFIDLFAGRTDAYGTWTGGKQANEWDDIGPIVQHLHDGPHVGVYPVTDDNHTRWGCIDIDGKDHPLAITPVDGPGGWDWEAMWGIANLIVNILKYKDATCWAERTANGIHLWVFAEAPVPAAIMRRALLVACQVADYHPKEVNPKQDVVDVAKPYGNYVRLPYYGYLKHGMPKDRFVIDEDGPMTLEQFSRSAHASRTPVEVLTDMAELYAPPPTKTTGDVDFDRATEEAFRQLEPILPVVVAIIFRDGPLNGDRSHALVKTAVILRDDGWRAQAVYTVLSALDARLGKFVDRPDREEQLLKIIEKVGL